MSNDFSEMLFQQFKVRGNADSALVQSGVRIGKREALVVCRPLILDLCDALDDHILKNGESRGEIKDLITRAERALIMLRGEAEES